MNIEEQFNLIAEEYDANRKKFIPCFEDFYKGTTDFIAANIRKPAQVLDLGAGTGLLTRFWYEKFPDAEYLLVDIAEEMLSVARKRFSGTDNVSFRLMDYIKEFPTGNSDLIISALSVHHLENPEKSELFAKIYDMLPEGGAFVNYDQFRAGEPLMDEWFDSYWESRLPESGLDKHDIGLWKERRKLDRECSAEEQAEMLRKCGYKIVKCVYSCQKFSVIIAIK